MTSRADLSLPTSQHMAVHHVSSEYLLMSRVACSSVSAISARWFHPSQSDGDAQSDSATAASSCTVHPQHRERRHHERSDDELRAQTHVRVE